MANVSLKTDFTDGEKLFGQQLNNNFAVIKAALETMNKIVWQDDPDDTVVTFRGTTEEINSRDIIDGQLLYDTSTGETYIDYGSQRISTGSGNAIFIGENEPTNPATQLWIDPTELLNVIGSEIESGSNENGNWIKYSDGTMICWNVISGSIFDCTQSAGNGRYYYTDTNNDVENSKRWTYPVEFKSGTLPAVSIGVSSSAYTVSSVGGVTASWCIGYCVTSYPVDGIEFNWHFIAIGRWK